jgi:hypothetical protein
MSHNAIPVVQQAVAVILRRLEQLPSSHTTERLRGWAEDCVRETVNGGRGPSPRQRDAVMKSVLALHVEVSRLERAACVAGPPS